MEMETIMWESNLEHFSNSMVINEGHSYYLDT